MELKKIFIVEMLLLASTVISFTAGFFTAFVDNKATIIVLALLPVITLGILIEWYKYYCKKLVKNRKSTADSKFSTPITSIDGDGNYTMSPQDLYDAIEKLGYIEHEWEGKL